MTDTLKGFPILAQSPTPARAATRAGRVVLLDVSREGGTKYATGWVGEGDRHWSSGHYTDDTTDAWDDYTRRVARGY
jgi:hypothetical protein